ncbi:Uu.00g046120.m01.CDS01 [Anthostomella pinea]|uniref:Uu.00g046120.m01.CDS01 n=1 Tax=Anthostomella pinea TaxID=933095 RepID=A0AAI8VB64_9PEZI|nr:Uu.00g046120.m01.CDS01 [Anthostomella pinea]
MATLFTQADVSTPSVGVEHQASIDGDPMSMSVTIRQDPLSVTLDGPAIFGLSLSLILVIHLLQPRVAVLLISLATAALFIHNDFRNYLKLGPGGTPPTFTGYLKINWLKLWALRNPFDPLPADPDVQPSAGVLHRKPLPYRCGARPTVVGIAPQRQVDQLGSPECYLALRRILEKHGETNHDEIGLGTSCFEKHGLGIFARYPFNNTCQGEICHVHGSDHSMQVIADSNLLDDLSLHPDDVKEVLEKGWGQRHPLTSQGLLKMPVPKQFTMVYAPRTMDELRVVCQIIEAAGYWVIGKEMRLDLEGEL